MRFRKAVRQQTLYAARMSLLFSHRIPKQVNAAVNTKVLIPKPRKLDTMSSVLLAFIPISIRE